jgi:hypothetical protein
MRWLWWHPERNSILSTVFGLLAILGVLFFVMLYFPFPGNQQSGVRAGFGPDWSCAPQVQGDPICIKKPGK